MRFRDCAIFAQTTVFYRITQFFLQNYEFHDKSREKIVFHKKCYFSQKIFSTACYLLFYTKHRHNYITDAQANNYILM